MRLLDETVQDTVPLKEPNQEYLIIPLRRVAGLGVHLPQNTATLDRSYLVACRRMVLHELKGGALWNSN